MNNTNALIAYDSGLFLFRVLAELGEQPRVSTERMDALNNQVIAIVNKLSVMKPIDISRFSELRTVAKDVILRLNLGLEYASQQDVIRASRLLIHNDMIRFYQIGNTLMTKLKRNAQEIQVRARLTVAESKMVQMGDHPETVMKMSLLHQREEDFLAMLINETLTIGEVTPVIEWTQEKGQSIEHLSQFETAERMLNHLNFRLDYLDTLPFHLMAREKDFRYARHLKKGKDLAGKITCSIMVNLAVESGRHFCVTLGDVRQFRQKCVDDNGISKAIEEMLLTWLIQYLASHKVTEEVVDYTYDYWMYCIRKLGKLLQSPVESREALYGWFIL